MPILLAPEPIESYQRRQRLSAAVDTLLESARRGDAEPDVLELAALHSICVVHGAFDASHAIRRFLAESPSLRHQLASAS